MNIPFLLTILLFLSSISLPAQKGEVRYELSPEKSDIKWTVKDGDDQYNGTIKVKEGYAVMTDERLTQLVVFANTQSIRITNVPNDDDRIKMLEYINSKEFLNTFAMNYAVFKMYTVDYTPDSKEGNYYIGGDLSMKAYSNRINFPVNVEVKKGKFLAEATTTFNRRLWKLENPIKADGTPYTAENTVTLYISLEGSKTK